MLEARNVSYRVGDAWLVRDIDLKVSAGETLSIVGPNGAGKSTLLRLLSGELKPTGGEIYLGGEPLSRLKPREVALRRAVLPQQTVLQFAFSVRDVVLMGRNPHLQGGWPLKQDYEIAARSLEDTEMEGYATRAYPSLSGGEQSRVTLSRVLAQQTPVLLLDEPTSSLDIRHQEMVMSLAKSLAGQGVCVVVIIHDLNLAAAYSDRIMLMSHGRLAGCGPTREVLQSDLLSDVFECPLRVLPDEEGGVLVVPCRSGERRPPASTAIWHLGRPEDVQDKPQDVLPSRKLSDVAAMISERHRTRGGTG